MKLFVNILTFMRIIATFLLPILWNIYHMVLILFIVSILLTDFLDGYLARKFNVQTLFGSILDCIADKLFGIITLIVLGKYVNVFWIIAIFEGIIAIINIINLNINAKVTSIYLGKIKMWLLGFTMVLGLILIFTNNSIISKFIYLCATILGSIYFLLIYMYLRRMKADMNDKNLSKLKNKKDLIYALFNTKFYLENKDKPLKELLYRIEVI